MPFSTPVEPQQRVSPPSLSVCEPSEHGHRAVHKSASTGVAAVHARQGPDDRTSRPLWCRTRALAVEFLENISEQTRAWRDIEPRNSVWLAEALQVETLTAGRSRDRIERRVSRLLVTLSRAVVSMDAVPAALRMLIQQLHVRVHPDHSARFELFAAMARIRGPDEESRQVDFLRLRALHTSPGGRALFGSTQVCAEAKLRAQQLLDVSEDARFQLLNLAPGEDPWPIFAAA